MDTYLQTIGRQIIQCLDTRGSREQQQQASAMMDHSRATIATFALSQLTHQCPELMDQYIWSVMFSPLIDRPTTNQQSTTTEHQIDRCLDQLQILLSSLPVLERHMQRAFVPSLLGPLLQLFAYSRQHPHVRTTAKVQQVLQSLISQSCPELCAAVIHKTLMMDNRLLDFQLGPTGGIEIRTQQQAAGTLCDDPSLKTLNHLIEEDELSAPASSSRMMIDGLLDVFSWKKIQETTQVIGHVFVSLLMTFFKHSNKTETVADPRMMMLTLMHCLMRMTTEIGPAALQNVSQLFECLKLIFTSTADAIHDQENVELTEIALGLASTILEARDCTFSPSSSKSKSKFEHEQEEAQLRKWLPSLERLSRHDVPEVAEMSVYLVAKLLMRSGGGGDPVVFKQQPRTGIKTKSIHNQISDAENDLNSALVPIRARGIVSLTKLIRNTLGHDQILLFEYLEPLLSIFMTHLRDKESYVYLAAVQGLAVLSNYQPHTVIPKLVQALDQQQQQRETSTDLETRSKLSEALMFAVRREGENVMKYSHGLVRMYLACIRPTASGSISSNDFENDFENHNEKEQLLTFRASCLSNLSEVLTLLKWSMAPYLTEVASCVSGILEFEPGHLIVRRGAMYVVRQMFEGLGTTCLEILDGRTLRDMYRLLQRLEGQDPDEVVRFHASLGLEALKEIMHQELFLDEDSTSSACAMSPIMNTLRFL